MICIGIWWYNKTCLYKLPNIVAMCMCILGKSNSYLQNKITIKMHTWCFLHAWLCDYNYNGILICIHFDCTGNIKLPYGWKILCGNKFNELTVLFAMVKLLFVNFLMLPMSNCVLLEIAPPLLLYNQYNSISSKNEQQATDYFHR